MASYNHLASEEVYDTADEIAPDGDIVFIVGPLEKRLTADACILRLSSPVLRAMLKPYYKEGQTLAADGCLEIVLRDDNAEAFEVVLSAIHGCNGKYMSTPTPEELLQVAIICDKYDCLSSISFAMHTWFTQLWMFRTKMPNMEEMWAWTMAACLCRDRVAFNDATSTILLNGQGSYIDLTRKHEKVIDPTLLLYTAAKLEEARHGIWMALFREIFDSDGQAILEDKSDDTVFTKVKAWGGQLEQATLSAILGEPSRNWYPSNNSEKGSYSEEQAALQSIAQAFLRRHESRIGLCLWCIRLRQPHEDHAPPPPETQSAAVKRSAG
ncbi:hypothetical protein HJFPF1_10054 [Paramyrothecium foliicola]|nr:hypothetical protein HJFPF1_10054 [Paramyrothecium foliicola]